MKTYELLLEIGTEEIPSGFISKALRDIEEITRKEFSMNRIEHGDIKTFGTPRRLVLFINEVNEFQKDMVIKKIGPPKQSAFDSYGNPTKAAIGFAKSQSVPIESIVIEKTDKGEYICAVKREPGKKTKEILPLILPKIILSIPFPKSMRWGEVSIKFVRPIHWILALFGGEVISFEIGNVRSGNLTYGHRFMHSGSIRIEDFDSYIRETKKAFVIIDQSERRKAIEEALEKEADKVSGRVLYDEDLLNEVNFLVEYPVALCGKFDEKFLFLPKEIIIHAMKEHQRYFPLEDQKGKLLPYFIFISNILAKDNNIVIRGNERVLQARLSDASFFFNEDLKIPLEKRVEQLKQVVFQTKLGSSYEKIMRFKRLALWIADRIDPEWKEAVERASILCKADLVTGMVGEFPKLQGIVGREYARIFGERPEVYEAIYEHYLPNYSGDRLPSSPVGDFISIADKMDTIVGCFGIGLVPTGTSDPFGLRRQALGIIRIIIEKGYKISLIQLIEESEKYLKDKMERAFEEVRSDVLEFFRARFENLLIERGYSHDVIEAVTSTSFDDLVDIKHRIDALREVREWEDFESVVIGFKRAMNILKGCKPQDGIDPSLFIDPAERNLYHAFMILKEKIDQYLENKQYNLIFKEMAQMKKTIDEFFDQVMVMVDNEKIRNNRLSLLQGIGKTFLRVADFSKLS